MNSLFKEKINKTIFSNYTKKIYMKYFTIND